MLLINLFMVALGLHCYIQASSIVGSKGYSLVAVCVASHGSGFSCFGAWALGPETPEDAAPGPRAQAQ